MGYSFISYTSNGLVGESLDDIRAISAIKNNQLHLTGLLYIYGSINFQTMEGKLEDIETLMSSIRKDDRHQYMHEFTPKKIVERVYEDKGLNVIVIEKYDFNQETLLIEYLEILKKKYLDPAIQKDLGN